MKNSTDIIKRIICVVLVLTFTICIFSSCGNNEDPEEITRSSMSIEKPVLDDETEPVGEVTTDPAATKQNAQNTTSASSEETTEPITITNDPEINEAINDAAQASGMSPEQIARFIQIMGYDYDSTQGIFYTSLDNWQRQANFVAHYDTAAHYVNMNYRTVRLDFFDVEGLDWRIQLWKGQYGAFGGCEIGIYTKDPVENKMLYHCVDNDHLIQMESSLYLNKADYEAGKLYFSREWQAHWWLTGFKPGVVNPNTLIMTMRIRMRSNTMATKFVAALEEAGFEKGDAKTQYNTYKRSLNDIYILWDDIGELNYVQQK